MESRNFILPLILVSPFLMAPLCSDSDFLILEQETAGLTDGSDGLDPNIPEEDSAANEVDDKLLEADLKKDIRALRALEKKFEPIKIQIAWGSSKHLDDVKEYTFDSEEEYLAFLKGVDESNGWMDYDTIGNHQCNWPNIEMWKRQYCPEEKSDE